MKIITNNFLKKQGSTTDIWKIAVYTSAISEILSSDTLEERAGCVHTKLCLI